MQDKLAQAAALRAEGMTHPEIAKAMGCSQSSVALYLNPELLAKHKARSRERARKRYAADPAKVLAASKAWARANPDKVNERQRRYWAENADKKRQYARAYYHSQVADDPRKRRAFLLRAGLCNWFQGRSKVRRDGLSIPELVGCSLESFRQHIASQFTGPMSWETYGKEWELDHIQPIIGFDVTDWEQAKQAFNYLNTRPLHPSLNRGRERREKRM